MMTVCRYSIFLFNRPPRPTWPDQCHASVGREKSTGNALSDCRKEMASLSKPGLLELVISYWRHWLKMLVVNGADVGHALA